MNLIEERKDRHQNEDQLRKLEQTDAQLALTNSETPRVCIILTIVQHLKRQSRIAVTKQLTYSGLMARRKPLHYGPG